MLGVWVTGLLGKALGADTRDASREAVTADVSEHGVSLGLPRSYFWLREVDVR